MADQAQVEVVNTALDALGKAQVSDLDEASLNQNAAARKIMAQLGPATRAVLARHGWLCALQYGALAPATIAGDVNWKFAYTYLLPAGAVRAWEVRGPTPPIPFLDQIDWLSFNSVPPLSEFDEWEWSTIDTDQGAQVLIRSNIGSQLLASWVRTPTYTAMTPHLRDAVGLDAARRCAFNVLGDQSARNALKGEAENAVLMAISVDGTQASATMVAPSITAMLRAISR